MRSNAPEYISRDVVIPEISHCFQKQVWRAESTLESLEPLPPEEVIRELLMLSWCPRFHSDKRVKKVWVPRF